MGLARTPLDIDSVSVIVVDDARFTCEMIRRMLKGAGYHDIRVANSAHQALEMMRERKANILLADWLMPEVDGLDLTRQVRQFDEETNHYTYVVLLTAKEGVESLTEAFTHGVDDFINKSPDNKELLARINAAGRISSLQNALLKANQRLTELNRLHEERHSFDTITGLGNRAYLERQLDNLLRHVEARGGAACVAAIRINDFPKLVARYGEAVGREVLEAAANRLQQSTRPLDVVTRIDQACFGVLMNQEDLEQCHPNAFRRIHQALNLRAYKTSAGFLSIGAAVSICGLGATEESERPEPGEIIDFVSRHLGEAQLTGRVHMVEWRHRAPG
ncbi:response regulator [Alkalilimnicola sp. S0819]|uniref:GGDEF domain-containing response regulator n=1 Tax=Alkalilimnicola sp. S0819 TaxID=2613922 RepID=UPI0012629638|nr:response regulator [Alkalilimnicola sp. S0819]KAB7624195.1 response regulator [Alkalilimnicola sp. S0819]MPQ16450.1 response regulator [Alkalilimnicola sp. S0819]